MGGHMSGHTNGSVTPNSVLVLEYLSAGGEAADADGELLAQGRAMRDALATDLCAVPGLAVHLAMASPDEPLPAALAAQPRLSRIAPHDGEDTLAFAARAALAADASWMVAPESGGLLARLQAAVGPRRWLGCDALALHVAESKRETLALLARAGVRTPLACECASRGWVVKPDDGAGAVATRRHASRSQALADLAERCAHDEPATIEPWIEGEPLSLSLLVDARGVASVLARNRQRIELDAQGFVHFRGVDAAVIDARNPRAPALDILARAVVAALPGLRGFVGIDAVWSRALDAPVAIEVNPRLTSAFVGLSGRLGRNVGAEVLAASWRPEQLREPA